MTYVDHVLEVLAIDGERESLVAGDTRLTRAQARDLLLRYADGLHQRGVRSGDGVGVFLGNRAETVLVNLAVHLLGGRLVFLPPEPPAAKLREVVERAELVGVVVDPRADDRLDGWDLSELAGEPVERTGDPNFATVFSTGGTTGDSKLATHGPSSYAMYEHLRHLPARNTLVNTLVVHGSGHSFSTLSMITGSKFVLGPTTFDAGTTCRLITDERIESTAFVPPMLYEVLDHPDCPQAGLLQGVFVGGAPLAPSRMREAIERWGPVVAQGYGLSEALAVSRLDPGEVDPANEKSLRTVGKPNPAIEVRIEDGHVQLRGPSVMTGYWGEEPLGDKWFDTGDIGYLEDGYLYLVDRSRDVIVTGQASGNVYSRLLDDFLVTLPGIRAAAAVGVPDASTGEAVHVFLVLHEGHELDAEKLRASVTNELGSLYAPTGITIVPRLPQTRVGKVDKKQLRSMLG